MLTERKVESQITGDVHDVEAGFAIGIGQQLWNAAEFRLKPRVRLRQVPPAGRPALKCHVQMGMGLATDDDAVIP